MFLIVLVLLIGMVGGFILRGRKRTLKILDRGMTAVIFILLFFLGLAFGSNEMLVKNFGRVGFTSALFSIGSVIGSVAVSSLVFWLFFKDQPRGGEKR